MTTAGRKRALRSPPTPPRRRRPPSPPRRPPSPLEALGRGQSSRGVRERRRLGSAPPEAGPTRWRPRPVALAGGAGAMKDQHLDRRSSAIHCHRRAVGRIVALMRSLPGCASTEAVPRNSAGRHTTSWTKAVGAPAGDGRRRHGTYPQRKNARRLRWLKSATSTANTRSWSRSKARAVRSLMARVPRRLPHTSWASCRSTRARRWPGNAVVIRARFISWTQPSPTGSPSCSMTNTSASCDTPP